MAEERDVWQKHARQWERLGPPLRPRARDAERMELVRDAWPPRDGGPRTLILGVTPELARLDWPAGTDLLAVDRSLGMIEGVWPGFPAAGEGAMCADWDALPLAERSRDLVLGDGVFAVLPYPGGHRDLIASLRRVLRADGLFAFRTFVRPESVERPEEVFGAAMAGEIGTFHAFKLRLLMSLQPDTRTGVRTGDAWAHWASEGPAADELAGRSGWPRSQIDTIEAYRGRETVYHFPTLGELRALLTEEGLEEIDCYRPAYELGERCPTLVFAPRWERGPGRADARST